MYVYIHIYIHQFTYAGVWDMRMWCEYEACVCGVRMGRGVCGVRMRRGVRMRHAIRAFSSPRRLLSALTCFYSAATLLPSHPASIQPPLTEAVWALKSLKSMLYAPTLYAPTVRRLVSAVAYALVLASPGLQPPLTSVVSIEILWLSCIFGILISWNQNRHARSQKCKILKKWKF